MNIQFWSIGKAHESFVNEGILLFTKRISHYYNIQWQLISNIKNAANLHVDSLKIKEGELVTSMLKKDDYLILLDEHGKVLDSPALANLIGNRADEGCKSLIFLVGGAFGVSAAVTQRANFCWSLSPLVFPHQIVRLLLAEQVYRACTINRNENYHHS